MQEASNQRPSAGTGGSVSVVIPTRNRRALLLQALRCVLGQRSIDLEAIVVDDGSTDGSDAAVAASRDPRVHVLRHESPRGVAAARNAGGRAAAGAWLAFLDDDDLWAPDKLAHQLAATRAADVAWAYAGAVEIDDAGKVLGGAPPPAPASLMATMRERNPMPAGSSNVLVSSATFHSFGGFDEGLRHLADWDLWLRLAGVGAPASVPEPLIAYRLHTLQATLDSNGMLAEARVLHDRHGIEVNAVRRWLAWSHLRRGRRAAAALAYARAAPAGDLTSLGRAAVAMVHPRPLSLGRRRGDEPSWALSARAWVREATEDRT